MIPQRRGGRWSSRFGVRALVGVFLVAAGVGGIAFAASARQEQAFPHERHQRLFPLCTGCHEGIPSGDAASFYPAPESCAGCHNGEDQVRVTWSGAAERVKLALFLLLAATPYDGETDAELLVSAMRVMKPFHRSKRGGVAQDRVATWNEIWDAIERAYPQACVALGI